MTLTFCKGRGQKLRNYLVMMHTYLHRNKKTDDVGRMGLEYLKIIDDVSYGQPQMHSIVDVM